MRGKPKYHAREIKDGRWIVTVTPDYGPVTEFGDFATEKEANGWIAAQASVPLKSPRDSNQLAKSIIDIATGERPDTPPDDKDPAAVQRGRLGGLKGGKARAEKLTPAERKASALAANRARSAKT